MNESKNAKKIKGAPIKNRDDSNKIAAIQTKESQYETILAVENDGRGPP